MIGARQPGIYSSHHDGSTLRIVRLAKGRHCARLGLLLASALLSACGQWSCSELQFRAAPSRILGAQPVPVTAADEKAHAALAWVASEISNGKISGLRHGRRLVDDFWAFARDRGVNPSGVAVPVFIVRGTPVLVTPISHCLW